MILAAKWIKMVQMYIFMWLIAQLEKFCHIRMNGWKGIEFIISFPDINFFIKKYFFEKNIFYRKITNERASTDLKYIVTSRLGVQATDIHVPYKDLPDGLPGSKGIFCTFYVKLIAFFTWNQKKSIQTLMFFQE